MTLIELSQVSCLDGLHEIGLHSFMMRVAVPRGDLTCEEAVVLLIVFGWTVWRGTFLAPLHVQFHVLLALRIGPRDEAIFDGQRFVRLGSVGSGWGAG